MLAAKQKGEATEKLKPQKHLVSSLMALAQSKGSNSGPLTGWVDFVDGAMGAGYVPLHGSFSMKTPEEVANVESALVDMVGEMGATGVRTFFSATGTAGKQRKDLWATQTGYPAPTGTTSETFIQNTQNFQRITGQLQNMGGKVGGLTERVERVPQVGDTPDPVSIAAEHRGIADEIIELETLLATIGSDEANANLLHPGSPISVALESAETKLDGLTNLFDANRKIASLQLEQPRNFGEEDGTILINQPGFGGAVDANGQPTEQHVRNQWFESPTGEELSDESAVVVDVVMNMTNEELTATGNTGLRQLLDNLVKDGSELTLRTFADMGLYPKTKHASAQLIQDIFKLSVPGTKAQVTELRTAKTNREDAVTDIRVFNDSLGANVLNPNANTLDGLIAAHGDSVEVPTGEGGTTTVKRFVTGPGGTLSKWITDDPTAIDALAIGVAKTTPPMYVDGVPQDYYPDEALKQRVFQVAAAQNLNVAQTDRLLESTESLDTSSLKIIQNPLARLMPTPVTPVMDGFEAATQSGGVGGGLTFVLSDEQHAQVEASRRDFVFSGNRFSSDKARSGALDALRASALAPRAAQSQKTGMFGSGPPTALELGFELEGYEVFTLADFAAAFAENGHPLFRNGGAMNSTRLMGDRAADRRGGGFDSDYLTGSKSLVAEHIRLHGDQDAALIGRLSFLDAMRAQNEQHSAKSADQMAVSRMLVKALRGMDLDEAVVAFGSSTSTGMPFGDIDGLLSGPGDIQPQLVTPESLVNFGADSYSLQHSLTKLKRFFPEDGAPGGSPGAYFARHPGPTGDVEMYSPLDKALVDGLITNIEGTQEAINSYEISWRADDTATLFDGTLGRFFSDTTMTHPGALASLLDVNSDSGKEIMANLTGMPSDDIEDMFKTYAWGTHVTNAQESRSMRESLGHVLMMFKDVTIARSKALTGNQSPVGKDEVSRRHRMLSARIDDYLNTYDSITSMLEPGMTAASFNPVIAEILHGNTFDMVQDETVRKNMLFGAFLLAK
jgi:hypothetical protein